MLSSILYAIISPSTREDYNEIKNDIRKKLIKDKIKDRDDFKKLVNYVFENRADGNKTSLVYSGINYVTIFYKVEEICTQICNITGRKKCIFIRK